jgi:hypothetical protein
MENEESGRFDEPVGRVHKKIHAHINSGHNIGEVVELFLPRAVHFCLFVLGGDHENKTKPGRYPNRDPRARK